MRIASKLTAVAALFAVAALSAADQQYLEVRTYQLRSADELPAVDAYMEKALLPALGRLGAGPVGVLLERDPEGAPRLFVMIPFKSLDQFGSLKAKLEKDSAYQAAAAKYFDAPRDAPRFNRIESEVLLSFKAFPQVHVPAQQKQGKPRLFELRTYESHTEHMGALKVEMFNSGEVPIFLDCGIQPAFMGQALAGPRTPNLTYMTVYDDEAAMTVGWDKFRDHPDWKKLSGVEKYKGSVSKIHKTLLVPRPYSQL